jgi:hypothetical protein
MLERLTFRLSATSGDGARLTVSAAIADLTFVRQWIFDLART